MREPWMMFTKDQGQELIGNTTSTWDSINGVNGRKFTNKTDTSKYIFLPAGGFWDYDLSAGGSYYSGAGFSGYCWSTTILSSNPSFAYHKLLYNLSPAFDKDKKRSYGMSIRGVRLL